jgi:hypothetical protein
MAMKISRTVMLSTLLGVLLTLIVGWVSMNALHQNPAVVSLGTLPAGGGNSPQHPAPAGSAGESLIPGGQHAVTVEPSSSLPTAIISNTPEITSRELRSAGPANATPFVVAFTLTNKAATMPETWTNSLGMEFVTVPSLDVLFCVWLTRNQDYQAFVSATGKPWTLARDQFPSFPEGPAYPAVNMSYFDAQAFCNWLTEKEQQTGQLDSHFFYRLPSEHEWEVAASTGAVGSPASGPPTEYPWGNQWPPPWGFANYATRLMIDSYAYTSLVGSFPTNKFGIYDISGNVHQWCEFDDQETVKARFRINAPILGGSFAANATTSEKVTLRCSYHPASGTGGQMTVGFRLVFARMPSIP